MDKAPKKVKEKSDGELKKLLREDVKLDRAILKKKGYGGKMHDSVKGHEHHHHLHPKTLAEHKGATAKHKPFAASSVMHKSEKHHAKSRGK